MNAELYIDGVRADISVGTEVNLELFSPLFANLSEIGDNYSYSIEVPNTATNAALFGFSNRADVVSTFPLTEHTAALYIDGVQIFTQGIATLTAMTPESYTLSLVWGIGATLATWWDTPLSEVYTSSDESAEHLTWDATTQYAPTTDGFMAGFLPYFGRAKEANVLPPHDIQYTLPMVSTKAVLGYIEQGAGVSIDHTNLTEFLLPLTTLNGSAYATANGATTDVVCTGTFDITNGSHTARLSFSSADDPDDIASDTRLRATDGNLYVLPSQMRFYVSKVSAANLRVTCYDSADNQLLTYTVPFTVAGNAINAQYSYGNHTPYVAYLKMAVEYTVSGSDVIIGTTTDSTTIQAYTTNRAKYGAPYPILPNLPEMTCGEFITSLCQLSGAYAFMTPDGVLSFGRLNAAIQGGERKDMSAKYTSESRDGTLVSAEWGNRDFAQRNELKYTQADIVRQSGDGFFSIPNTLLSPSAVVIESPYTPTDSIGAFMYLPLWAADGTWEGIDEPPIISIDSVIFSDAMTWQNILSDKYNKWVALLQQWRKYSVHMVLAPYDIAALDWAKAWHIDALGGDFLPWRISYTSAGLSDVELIKL